MPCRHFRPHSRSRLNWQNHLVSQNLHSCRCWPFPRCVPPLQAKVKGLFLLHLLRWPRPARESADDSASNSLSTTQELPIQEHTPIQLSSSLLSPNIAQCTISAKNLMIHYPMKGELNRRKSTLNRFGKTFCQ